MYKKLLMVLAVLLAVAPAVFAGGGQEQGSMSAEEMSGKIVVWSFTDEVGGMIEHFNAVYPNIEVEFVVIPNQDEVYLNKINTTLRSRSEVPDVFTGERAWFRQIVESGFWEPISGAPYNAEDLIGDMVPYVPELARDASGEITALSWQATPGALFYRRDIAMDVLGTDDPAVVSEWTGDINKFYELGEMIKEYYGGEKFLLSGYTDMSEFIFNRRTEPYVDGDVLTIPEALVEYMTLARDMRENRIEAGAGTWSPPWFSSMADGSVFSYILPTWGLHYVMKPNADPEGHESGNYAGDWGLATPPAAYSWGGTWIGINRFSEQKDLAWEFVKFIGYEPQFHEAWAKQTGDFVGNISVVESIKDDFADPFLAGQNHYDYFYNEVKKIRTDYIGPWDFQIQNAWGDQVEQYANGEKTMDQAIEDFKVAILDVLPNLTDIKVDM